jgi:hypothetical protein
MKYLILNLGVKDPVAQFAYLSGVKCHCPCLALIATDAVRGLPNRIFIMKRNITKDDLKLGARVAISIDGELFPSRILGVERVRNGFEDLDWFLLTGNPQWTNTDFLSESKINDFKATFPNMFFFKDIKNYLNCNLVWIKVGKIDPIKNSFRFLLP